MLNQRMKFFLLRIYARIGKYIYWQYWPGRIFYVPVFLYYLWLSLVYGSFTLPTAANPGLINGGIVGDSKSRSLLQLQAHHPSATAPTALIKGSTPAERYEALKKACSELSISLPYVLKPDNGRAGAGVRVIRSLEQARAYCSLEVPFIVQGYSPGPHEAGVYYYRYPHEKLGQIYSITHKIFPTVIGDGKHTVEQLIFLDSSARFLARTYLERLGDTLAQQIPPVGEKVPLVQAGNRGQGCIFVDGMHLWSPALEKRFDEISHGVKGFFVGRYDVRYSDREEFVAGKGFEIVELNGAGALAITFDDTRQTLFGAYGMLMGAWDIIFKIAKENKVTGVTVPGLKHIWNEVRKDLEAINAYGASD